MAYDIGLKVGIDGESDFKRALSEINSSLKTLGTEAKLVASEFDEQDKSVSALTEKNKVLQKQIDEQSKKVQVLSTALEDAKRKYGDNSSEAQRYQRQLNNAQAELNKMNRTLEKNKSDMQAATSAEKEGTKATEDFGKAAKDSAKQSDNLSNGMKNISAAAIAAAQKIADLAVVAAKKLVDVGKSAVEAYGEYEQLIGGVDTLFGEGADLVEKNAARAFKTAGMSANEYMKTVTSFSASLIQGVGGDTQKAAELADIALQDMSDNANKLGTDISMIQNAYQGLARNTYTMLDNLKIGYQGTKTEAERLIKDANAILVSQGKAASLTIGNFADMVQAIHLVQQEMKITGTTADEAERTLQGSSKAVKAAWENLVVGIADDKQDFDKLLDDFITSILTSAKNMIPRIKNAIIGMSKLLTGLAKDVVPVFIRELLPALKDLLPVLMDTINTLVKDVLPTLIPDLLDVIMEILDAVAEMIEKNLSPLVEGVLNLFNIIIAKSLEQTPKLVSIVRRIFEAILGAVTDNLDTFVESIVAFIPDIVAALVKSAPEFAKGFITLLVEIVKSIPSLFVGTITGINGFIDGVKRNIFGDQEVVTESRYTQNMEERREQIALMKEQNTLLEQIARKDTTVTITDDAIGNANRRYSQTQGLTLTRSGSGGGF